MKKFLRKVSVDCQNHCINCDCLIKEGDEVESMDSSEVVCESCSNDMEYCDTCQKFGTDDDFSYGGDAICNNCLESKADMMRYDD